MFTYNLGWFKMHQNWETTSSPSGNLVGTHLNLQYGSLVPPSSIASRSEPSISTGRGKVSLWQSTCSVSFQPKKFFCMSHSQAKLSSFLICPGQSSEHCYPHKLCNSNRDNCDDDITEIVTLENLCNPLQCSNS